MRIPWRLTLLLFIVALVPRVYEIGAHLPEHFHPDEDKEMRRAINLLRGQVDYERIHKGGLFTILAVEFGGLYLFQRVTGKVNNPDEFAIRTIAADPTPLFLLDRLTVALLGAACAVLAFRLAGRLGGSRAGLWAGILVACFAPHLELSRVGRLDVPLCFGVLLTLDLALAVRAKPSLNRFLALAAAAALTVSTKTSGAPYLVAALPAAWAWLRRRGPVNARAAGLGIAALVSLASVAALNTALFRAVVPGGQETAVDPARPPAELMDQYAGVRPSLFDNYVYYPFVQLGPVVIFFALVGVGFLIRQGSGRIRASVPWWIAGIVLQVGLLATLSDLVSWRYLLPAELLVLILAAVGARHLAQELPLGWRRKVALALFPTLLLFPIAASSLNSMQRELLVPTPVAAHAWIKSHIPPGEAVALEGNDVFPSEYMPRLPHTPESLVEKIENLEVKDSGKAALLRKYFLPALPDEGYEISLYNYNRNVPTWERWQTKDVRTVVLHDLPFPPPPDSPYGTRVRVLREFCERNGRVVKRFIGDDVRYRGVTLTIYQLGDLAK